MFQLRGQVHAGFVEDAWDADGVCAFHVFFDIIDKHGLEAVLAEIKTKKKAAAKA